MTYTSGDYQTPTWLMKATWNNGIYTELNTKVKENKVTGIEEGTQEGADATQICNIIHHLTVQNTWDINLDAMLRR